MTEYLHLGDDTLAYEVSGQGPLVVLAHGIGDSRTDIAGDLVALVRHLGGGPAVIIGQSISGGAATIAAATAPDLIAGIVELSPFTRAQSFPLGALLTNKSYRNGAISLMRTLMTGDLNGWKKYLDLAYPTKPADWETEMARINAKLREPGRMSALQAMGKAKPTDTGVQLANVRCPVLVVVGRLDPDWADPRAEGQAIIDELPAGLGELVVLDGVGHYPHAQAPDQLITMALPFLAKAFAVA